jgi:hypothetical protein
MALLFFQNCSDKIQLVKASAPITTAVAQSTTTFCMNNPNDASCSNTPAATCQFNGSLIPEGGQVTAFLNSTPETNGICVAEFRNCSHGVLSGSYQFPSCSAGNAGACLFNGALIQNGNSVTAYEASALSIGQSCASESRLCTNGVLSGSYAFTTCQSGVGASCSFDGQNLLSSSTAIATYPVPVPYGTTCAAAAQMATCQNGNMVNALASLSCTVGPQPCSFGGVNYPSGRTGIVGYTAATVPYGTAGGCSTVQENTLTCTNGIISGGTLNPDLPACTVAGPASCTLPDGSSIADGAQVTMYLAPGAATCTGLVRTCHNGALDGSALYSQMQAIQCGLVELVGTNPTDSSFPGWTAGSPISLGTVTLQTPHNFVLGLTNQECNGPTSETMKLNVIDTASKAIVYTTSTAYTGNVPACWRQYNLPGSNITIALPAGTFQFQIVPALSCSGGNAYCQYTFDFKEQ